DRLEFQVEGVVQQLLVHVPYQVDEAFLLGAVERVVCGVEVRHQHTLEILEQAWQKVSLPRGSETIHDLLSSRENPHIRLSLPQFHFRLVDVKNLARKYFGEQPLARRPVVSGHQPFERVDLLRTNT